MCGGAPWHKIEPKGRFYNLNTLTMVGASAGGLSLTVGTLGWSAYPPVRAQEPALGLGGGVGVPAPATGREAVSCDKGGAVPPIKRHRLNTCLLRVVEQG